MTKLSVIIVSWNCRRPLQECLQSLDALHLDSYETIVIDNNSEDGTVTFLKTLEGSAVGHRLGLKVCYCTENTGWAGGNEKGVAMAAGNWLLLCNPDIVFTNEFREMMDYADRHDVSVLAPQLVKPNGDKQRCLRQITFTRLFFGFTMLGEFLDAGIGHRFVWKDFRYGSYKFEKPVQVDHPSASFLLIRREIISRLDYLISTNFPIYFGDSDLFKRLNDKRIPVIFLPAVKIMHEMGYSGRRVSPEIRNFLWTNSVMRYANKWKLHPTLLVLLFFIDAIIRPFLSYERILKLPHSSDARVSAYRLHGLINV